MPRLCRFQNLLGTPGTGIHATRFLGFAMNDIVATIIGAYLIQKFLLPSQTFPQVLLKLVLLGIFLHWLFCVPTRLNTLLGLA